MRTMLTAMGLAILAGCGSAPRTVERVTTVTCPATPPVLVCPGWRPDYRPVNVHELQSLFLERGDGLRCRDVKLELWAELHAGCAPAADPAPAPE